MLESLDVVKSKTGLEALENAYKLRSRTLGRAQIRIFQLETQLEDLKKESEKTRQDWEKERGEFFQSIMRRDTALSKLHIDLQTAKQSCADLTASADQRFREISYLTKRVIIAEDAQTKALSAQSISVKELRQVSAQLAKVRRRHDAAVAKFFSSRSWRITAPMRQIMAVLRKIWS